MAFNWSDVAEYEEVIDLIPCGVIVLTYEKDAKVLVMNKAALELFGCETLEDFRSYTKNEIQNSVVSKDFFTANASLAEQLAKNYNRTAFLEYRILRKDGTIRLVTSIIKLIALKNGESAYLSIIFDSSKSITRVLKAMEPHFFKIVKANLARDAFIVIKDLSGDTRKKSKKHSVWLSEFTKNGVIHPEDAEYFSRSLDRANLTQYFASGKNNMIVRYRRQFGEEYKWVTMIISRAEEYSDENPAVTFFLRYSDDDFISNREEGRQIRLISALTQSFDSIYILNTETRSVYSYKFNSALAKQVDMQISDKYSDYVIANTAFAHKFICPEDRENYLIKTSVDYILRRLQRDSRYEVIFRQYKDKNTLEHIQLSISPVDEINKTQIILAYKNITLQVSEEQQKMLSHRTDEILRSISTDLIFLLEIDLRTENQRHYFVYQDYNLGIPEWTDSENFRQCAIDYSEKIVAANDRARFLAAVNLDSLKKRLEEEKNFTIEYDASVRGKKRRFQGYFILQKDNFDADKIFISTRDITK